MGIKCLRNDSFYHGRIVLWLKKLGTQQFSDRHRTRYPILFFFSFVFLCSKSIFLVFLCTVSGRDGGNRTRNITAYTWRFSLLSYDRHPYWAMTVTKYPSPIILYICPWIRATRVYRVSRTYVQYMSETVKNFDEYKTYRTNLVIYDALHSKHHPLTYCSTLDK